MRPPLHSSHPVGLCAVGGQASLLLPFPGANLSWWPSQTSVVQSTAEGLEASQLFTGCITIGTLINPSVPQFPHLCSGYRPHTAPCPPQGCGEVGLNEALRALFHTQRLLCLFSALSDLKGCGHLRAGDRLTLWLEGFSGRVLIRPLHRCCSGVGRNSRC